MPIAIKCADCGTETTLSDAAAGKTAKCPKCGNYIRVPGERVVAAPVRQSSSLAKPIAAAVALTLIGCGVAWYLGFLTPKSAAPPSVLPIQNQAAATASGTSSSSQAATGTGSSVAVPAATGTPAAPAALTAEMNAKLAWAEGPANAVLVAGISDPGKMLKLYLATIVKVLNANPMLLDQFHLLQKASVDSFGADLTNAENFEGIGIDINKPMTLTALEMDAINFPGVVFGAGITNPDAIMKTVRRMAAQDKVTLNEDKSAQPAVFTDGSHVGVTIFENRIYVLSSVQSQNCANSLRRFLEARHDMRDSNADFQASMRDQKGPGEVNYYFNFNTSLAKLPPDSIPAILEDFRSFVFKSDENETRFCLNLQPNSRFLRDVRPGAPCAEFVARLDRPIAAVTVCAADLVDLIQYFAEMSGPMGAAALGSQIQAATGLTVPEWRALLKGGHLGIMFYKNDGLPMVRELCFFRVDVSNADKLEKIQAALTRGLNKLGESMPIYSQTRFAVMKLRELIIFGDALKQIEPTSQDSFGKRLWEPKFGNGELFSLEYFFGEMNAHMKKYSPGQGIVSLPDDAKIDAAVVQRGESLVYSTGGMSDPRVISMSAVAAAALPNMMRSRMAANETAAMNNCRAYCEAQEIYHRNAYRGDGVLQYAQALKGDNSLLETKAGQVDIAFIDKTFGNAEGNPSQNPTAKAGYCFKILTAQGPAADGGKRNYIVNKRMLLGYALVAYPKTYGTTGRDTFIINGNQIIYQKDLGPNTADIVEKMTEYNPEPGWVPTR